MLVLYAARVHSNIIIIIIIIIVNIQINHNQQHSSKYVYVATVQFISDGSPRITSGCSCRTSCCKQANELCREQFLLI